MIDLSDYTSKIIKFIKQRGLACIYVVSQEGWIPCKVGVSGEPWKRLYTIQSGNPHPVSLEFVLWTPGPGIARLIEKHIQVEFSERRLSGEWFDLPIEDLKGCIYEFIDRKLPQANLIEHGMLMKELETIDISRRDDTIKIRS